LALLVKAWMIWRSWDSTSSPAVRQFGLASLGRKNVPLFLLFCMPGEVRDLSLLYINVLFRDLRLL